jgi:hypothetical protein
VRRGAGPRHGCSPDLSRRIFIVGGRRERGRRPEVCRPQRAGRPPDAPEGRALDIKEPNSATQAERVCPVPSDARHMLAT